MHASRRYLEKSWIVDFDHLISNFYVRLDYSFIVTLNLNDYCGVILECWGECLLVPSIVSAMI